MKILQLFALLYPHILDIIKTLNSKIIPDVVNVGWACFLEKGLRATDFWSARQERYALENLSSISL